MKRHKRPRIEVPDTRTLIRGRYLEAIRAGANIHDATEFANARQEDRPRFIPINVEIPLAPKGYGKPGETEQLFPNSFSKVKVPVAPLPSTDPESESVKRPMMVEAVQSPDLFEKPAVAAEPVAPPPPPLEPVELPEGWDTKDFPWPNLRTLCLRIAGKTPHSRTDGANLIRAALAKTEG